MTQGVTRFRTSFGFVAGNVPALIVEGKVVGINLVNWTVDIASSFDRKRYYDIQVGSAYAHYTNGEGFYVVPEVGAKCMVCIPSDSTPPFVISFVMPPETVDLATADAPKGTTSQSSSNKNSNGSSFAGGRARAKPGDMWMKGRDGNFFIMHRGGLLQIGSTELAQRMYIPLNNYIMDISDNYVHYNQAGTSYWGMQAVESQNDYATEHFETFRIFAGDKYATVRIKTSKVDNPIIGTVDSEANLKQVVYEVAVAPQGFDAETGAIKDAKLLTLRFAFDKEGNALLGGTGELSVYFKKDIKITTEKSLTVKAGTSISVTAKSGLNLNGGAYSHLKGDIVKLGPGSKPVAHQGAMVQVNFPFTPVAVPGSPPLVLFGTITTGEPTVLT